MARAAKPPAKRAVRITKPADTRAAGHAAVASVAAAAPMAGAFYSPGDEPAKRASPLASLFTDTVHAAHVPLEHGGSVDREVAEHLAAEANDAPETLEAEIARIRAFRKPLGAMSQKLALPTRAGYHRHWFNDVAGRIEEATANGWAHVKGNDGKPISRCVGTGRDKGAQYAFAMELPLVFWQEDQDAKHQVATEKINSLKAQPFAAAKGQAKAADKGKFYDPHEETGTGPLQVIKS